MGSSNGSEKGNIRGSLIVFSILLVSLSGVGLLLWRYIKGPSANPPKPQPTQVVSNPSFQGDPAEATDKLYRALNRKLQDLDLLKLLNVEAQLPVTFQGKIFSTYEEHFRLPLLFSPDEIAGQLSETAKALGASLNSPPVTQREKNGEISHVYSFSYDPKWTSVVISFIEVRRSKICLIIDDGGYRRGEALQRLYALKVPVTVSIIPNVEFSKSLAEEFPDHGVEVMCHMPMEGHEKGAVGGNYKALLKKGMDPEIAKTDVEQALDDLPHCRGLNNHMGSVATEDPELIEGVCEALKIRGMFIIDSRTTPKSVVEKVAQRTGVAVASRNIFLDNIEMPDAIVKQLEQTAAYAKKHGLAVAIGHFKIGTLKTLEDAVPLLEAKGFQFVYASEVVRGN